MTELETLRGALNPAQLLFVDSYVSNYKSIANGTILSATLYQEAYPECKTAESARSNVTRLLNDVGAFKAYLAAVLASTSTKAVNNQIAGLDELKEYMTRNMRGINELFEDILCSRMYPVKSETGEIWTNGLFVDNLDEIPQHLLKYIEGARELENYGWLVKTKYSQADKDRNKCAEMLTRMQGGFIDKTEISGPGGGAINVTLSGDVTITIKEILASI